MTDYTSLQAKVNDLKAKVDSNSISPSYVGALLDDFISIIKSSDQEEDVAAALQNAATALTLARSSSTKADNARATAGLAANKCQLALDNYASVKDATDIVNCCLADMLDCGWFCPPSLDDLNAGYGTRVLNEGGTLKLDYPASAPEHVVWLDGPDEPLKSTNYSVEFEFQSSLALSDLSVMLFDNSMTCYKWDNSDPFIRSEVGAYSANDWHKVSIDMAKYIALTGWNQDKSGERLRINFNNIPASGEAVSISIKNIRVYHNQEVKAPEGTDLNTFAGKAKLTSTLIKAIDEAADEELKKAIEGINNNKVDKVTGKGLSANDYTDEDKAKLTALGALLSYPEDVFSYGVQFDTSISSPYCTRVGNVALHKTLPIQSRMRGCLLDDDGQVVEYLDPRDWTGQVRDGSRGQVMVEIPMHYRKFETNGTKCVVRLSEYPISGYHQVPKMYVSAYEASIERSTGKLCSVVNDSADYRGGDNNANYDGTYRSFLGRPVTLINRTVFRSAARKRKSGSSEWNCYLYQVHKALFWLFTVEYAQLDSQAAYNSELTSEGFRQGGLGAGVSDWLSSDWSTFNGYYPFVPCGHTDTLGNATGVVAYTAYNADGSELKTSNVPRYRGIENPFGHIWKWTDGCKCIIQSEASGALSKFYVCDDPAKFTASGVGNYDYRGNLPRSDGYVKALILGEDGEIMPLAVGGGSTTYFCDYFYTNIPSSGEAERGVLFGGSAYYGAYAGFVCAVTSNAPTYATAHIGSRLCFIPAN